MMVLRYKTWDNIAANKDLTKQISSIKNKVEHQIVNSLVKFHRRRTKGTHPSIHHLVVHDLLINVNEFFQYNVYLSQVISIS